LDSENARVEELKKGIKEKEDAISKIEKQIENSKNSQREKDARESATRLEELERQYEQMSTGVSIDTKGGKGAKTIAQDYMGKKRERNRERERKKERERKRKRENKHELTINKQ